MCGCVPACWHADGLAEASAATAAMVEAASTAAMAEAVGRWAASRAARRKCTPTAAATSPPGGREDACDDGMVARRRGRARGSPSLESAAPPAVRSDALRATTAASVHLLRIAHVAPKPRPRSLAWRNSPREPLELELLELERVEPKQPPHQRDEGGRLLAKESSKARGTEQVRNPRASTVERCKRLRPSLCSSVSELGSRTKKHADLVRIGEVPDWKSTTIPSTRAAIARAWVAATTMNMGSCFSIRGTAVREHKQERPAVQVYVREDLSLRTQRDEKLGGEQGVGLDSRQANRKLPISCCDREALP